MPPKKPAKPEDARKRVKKILTAIRRGERGDREAEAAIVADLAALLDADPAALAEVDAAAVLPVSAEQDMFAVYELLLARGADPHARVQGGWLPGLATLAGAGGPADDARVIALVEQLAARGADLDERGHREGALDRASFSPARVDALLRLGVGDDSVLAALRPTLARIPDSPTAAAVCARLLAHLASVDRPGADGLSALHVVALYGPPSLLAAALDRSQAPAHPVTAASELSTDHCSPPGGGLVPMLRAAPGFTARDLAAEMLAVYAAAIAWYGDAGFYAARRRARRDELTASVELLAARGVPHGAPDRGGAPAFVADVDALLARLAAHVGADEPALQRRAAATPLDGVGPWTYASTLLERSTGILLRGAVEAHVADSWLAHLVSGEHRRFVTAREASKAAKPDPADYPEAARRPVQTGMIVGGRGDTLLLVWPHAEGVARLGAVAPGAFTQLGDDLFGFLRGELTALGVAVDDLATGRAQGPGGGLTKLLQADRDGAPGPTDINRIGGRPIGLDPANWPRRAGKPMQHVLTIDLHDHPTYQPPGVRALALFISATGEHEAYAAGNDHTRVVLLSDADLARGETPAPPDLDAADLVAPARLRFESAATLTKEEIYRHSFASAFPMWLQGDESEDYGGDDDYADGEDDEYAEAPRVTSPGTFVLQFDQELIPEINLGDCGIMYVFSNSAWFQCH